MSRMRVCVVLVGALLVGCGGGSDGGSSDAEEVEATTSAPDTTSPPLDLPQLRTDLRRVCEDGVGFADLPAYDSTAPGPHRVTLLVEAEDGVLLAPSLEIPNDWTVGRQRDVEKTQLVGCGVTLERTPTGRACTAPLPTGERVTLDLVDVVYEVSVFEAASATFVTSARLEATNGGCPTGLLHRYREGQTEYFNVLGLRFDEAAVMDLLEPLVTP